MLRLTKQKRTMKKKRGTQYKGENNIKNRLYILMVPTKRNIMDQK